MIPLFVRQNPLRTLITLLVLWVCVVAMIKHSDAAEVCFTQACIQARAAASSPATGTSAAVAPQAAAPSYSLADDLAAATAEACSPTSATNPAPIDDHACTCNQFLQGALPNLKPDLGKVPGAISRLEQLRIIKIRLQSSTFSHDFHSACGALQMDITADLLTVEAFVANVLAR